MKARVSRFGGDNKYPDGYECKYDWECFCQAGGKGVVFGGENGGYTTAFFEAFPKEPSCFIRGEGKDIPEAEKEAWGKYQEILKCEHEMDRRNRTDGYAYCKNCSYSSTVFEPLTNCCKCNIPTAYTKDYRGNWYCKKHGRNKPKNPNPPAWDRVRQTRFPRKLKKKLKLGAIYSFRLSGMNGKITAKWNMGAVFYCENKQITILFRKEKQELIRRGKMLKTLRRLIN